MSIKRVHQLYHLIGTDKSQARTLCGWWLSKPPGSKEWFNRGKTVEATLELREVTCEKCLTARGG